MRFGNCSRVTNSGATNITNEKTSPINPVTVKVFFGFIILSVSSISLTQGTKNAKHDVINLANQVIQMNNLLSRYQKLAAVRLLRYYFHIFWLRFIYTKELEFQIHASFKVISYYGHFLWLNYVSSQISLKISKVLKASTPLLK